MKNRMLDAANVLIDRKPIGDCLGIKRRKVIVCVGIAIEVSGRIDEGAHGVGFTAGGAAAFWTDHIDEFGNLAEG